jgi:hypothetical protein
MAASRTGSVARAVAYGVASIALYVLLFVYADETVELARRTREGDKILFLVPIVIAFAFSFVHGAFTGHFWAAIGLKPAAKSKKKK